ncbi:MAG: filamentous hemagglutinin N-terminal domain-containing protein, partial [Rhodocyclales bacterium]|nr:filamentous hemagglutinin N-terminal domain-containing protein [Rhodocyclales bacterium]
MRRTAARRAPRRRQILAAALALFGAPAWALDAAALPTGGKLVAGSATLSQTANVLTVRQTSQRAALDWQSFDIGAAAGVDFVQPSSSSITLNRILGNDASRIYGKLNANGQVFLSNPHGMLFARGAQVNVGGILATTLHLGNDDFMAGRYRLTAPGSGDIRNEGAIAALGSAALIGNDVQNAGRIVATTVVLAAGDAVAIDLSGDGLIRARVVDAALRANIENSGGIEAAQVALTTGQTRDTLDRVVNNSGFVRATGLASVDGELVLESGRVANTGALAAANANGSGGNITLSGAAVMLGGTVAADGATRGGGIAIDADAASFAGRLSATGGSGAGGSIDIRAQTLALHNVWSALDVSGVTGGSIRETAGQQITSSATYLALGSGGLGGRIDMSAPATKLLSAQLDASGATGGGRIRLGGEYQGGRNLKTDELPNAQTLAISAGSSIKADATQQGDGGTTILWSELESALYPTISAKGKNGGGFVELSSAERLLWGGSVDAGSGGRVLMDPKNIVIQDASADLQYNLVLGYNYNGLPRLGIGLQTADSFGFAVALSGTQLAVGAIGDDGFANPALNSGAVYLFNNPYSTPTLAGIIGKGYTGTGNYNLAALESGDSFGYSVALSGTRLAVGAIGDDGYGIASTTSNSYGAVYLFDNPFSATPTLSGTFGKGYTGTGDYDAGALATFSNFGASVALSGTQLAVGAIGHGDAGGDGLIYGAVHLFKDVATTPTLSGIIGKGYTGSGNFDLVTLEDMDTFGRAVSLSGTQLAVGASGDDGADNLTADSGAVYLFSTPFSTPTLTGTLGKGYTGAGSYDFSALKSTDGFGTSVALSGTRLAAGAFGDDGYGAVSTTLNYGAVHLFSNVDGTPTFAGTLGKGYTGTGSFNMAGLKTSDAFGRSVALSGSQLAVGTSGDDGYGSTVTTRNFGAVHLFANADGTPTLAATLGSGYTGAGNVDLRLLVGNDSFGSAVSLSGTQLAVGAYGDQGYAGAVYLFSNPYTTPTLSGVIGKGYAGAGNFNVSTLETWDLFGNAVSLSGTQLAVCAYNDGGNGNVAPGSGAVYLFNNPYSASPTLAGVIGKGYTGTGSVNLSTLEEYDSFGSAVSLSGTQLAVGAFGDAGLDNLAPYSGAVYLFNNPYTAPALAGTIGKGYTGGGNIDLAALESGDYFGSAVSLSGAQLAVGAMYDAGADNATPGAGAVYLFNNPFTTPALSGRIGKGYTGSGSYDLAALELYDNFGVSVSLSGTQLAVGATGDAGFGNAAPYSGAVYLFNNLDTTPTLAGTIGKGYTGAGNLDLSALEDSDTFGIGVSLSGTQLAVGAPYDAGFNNAAGASGAVYLFSLGLTSSDPADGQLFSATPGTDATITPTSIVEILNTGAALTLQANNDVTVASNILVQNPIGAGGALTLQAGRSLLVNATIDTDGGALTLVANHAGADAAHRDAGTALLDASTATLRASTLSFSNTGGDILLNNLSATGAVVSDAPTFTRLTGFNDLVAGFDARSGGVGGAGALNIAGGWLVLGATSTLGGLTLDGGATLNLDGTLNAPSFTNNGTLSGTGTFRVGSGSGTLTNAGILAPGGDPGTIGTLTIDGHLANTASGVLKLDLNGTAAGSHDRLAVTGAASFAAGSSLDLFGFGGAGAYPVVTAAGGVSGSATATGGYFSQTIAINASNLTVTATANLLENAVTWDGGANTANWEDAANWSSDTLPGSDSNIFIERWWTVANASGASLGKNLVSRSPLALSGGSLTLAGSALFSDVLTISGGTLTSAGAITVASGGTLYWSGGSIDASAPAPLATLAGSTTYYSGGTLGANRAWTSSGDLRLSGNHTTASLPAFVRSGGSVNLAAVFDLGGSTLDIGSAGRFGAGGLTSFSGTLRNGTVLSTDATPLAASGTSARLDGVTLGGSALTASGDLIVNNGITLADGVTVDKGSATWKFGGSGTQHIATPGTATLVGSGGGLQAGYDYYAYGQTLQIDAGVTLQGWGGLTKNYPATFINAGTINANTAGQDFAVSSTTFTNSGTLNVTAGTMSLTPTSFTQNGNVNLAAGTTLSAPSFTNNGTLTGSGTLTVGGGTGTLTNARIIAPGDGPGAAGTLTLNGKLATSGANAVLVMDLNAADSFDRLVVGSTANFATGNKIELSGIGGAGAYSIVSTGGAITGTPTASSLTFTQTTAVAGNAVTVTATANTAENAIYWDGGAGTWNWADAANWSANALPTGADNVLINASGTVAIDAGTQSGKNLVSLSDFSLAGGSLDLSGTALFARTAAIGSGTLTSGGTITVASGATLNWSGGTLGATTAAALATLSGSTTNFSAGTLGANLAWTSSGTLNLAGNLSVAGLPTFTRTAGSTVNLTGLLDNRNNTLDVGDAGRFGSGGLTSLSGTIQGGGVRNSNATTPTLSGNNGTLDGVTLGGTALTTSGTLYIDNGITLADGLAVNKGSSNWYFRGSGTQHIATPGAATLSSAGNWIAAAAGVTGQTLQIDNGVTVQGSAAFGNYESNTTNAVVNAGIINANSAGQYFHVYGATFVNDGTINVNGGSLTIAPKTAAAENWSNAGTLNLASGTLSLGGRFSAAALASGHYTRSGGSVYLFGLLDNSGNTLDIGNAGLFGNGGLNRLDAGGTIKGGTVLSTNATPTLTSNGGALDGVTLGGSALTTSGTLYFDNGVTLADGLTVNIGSNAYSWYFRGTGTQHVATAGTAVINSAGSYLYASGSSATDIETLQIDHGVTLQGYGGLGSSNRAAVINAGTVNANTAGQSFTIAPYRFTNTGTLNASAGTLALGGGASEYDPSTGSVYVPYHWSNSGQINIANATLNLGGIFAAADLGNFKRSGGAVNIAGTLDNTGNVLDIGSAGLFGPGGLTAVVSNYYSPQAKGAIKNGVIWSSDATPLTLNKTDYYAAGPVLDGVTLGGTRLVVRNASEYNWYGDITILNNLTLADGVTVYKGNTAWNFANGGHLATTGAATLDMAGGSLAAAAIDSGVTVQGYGSLGTVANAGTIVANTAGQTLSLTGAFANSGTLNVSGGTLKLGSSYFDYETNTRQAEAWTNSGRINLNSGTLTLDGLVSTANLGGTRFSRAAGTSLNLSGIIDNTGATLDLGSAGLFGVGGVTSFGGALIRNGTLIDSDAAPLRLASGTTTLDGVAVDAAVNIGGGILNLLGAWSLPGSINLSAGALNLGGAFTTAELATRLAPAHYSRSGGAVNLIAALDNTGSTLDIGGAGMFGVGGLTSFGIGWDNDAHQIGLGSIKNGTILSGDGTPLFILSGNSTATSAVLDGVTLGGSTLKISGLRASSFTCTNSVCTPDNGGSKSVTILNNLTLADGLSATLDYSYFVNFASSGVQHVATTGTATLSDQGSSNLWLDSTSTGRTLQIDAGVTVKNLSLYAMNNTLINNGTIVGTGYGRYIDAASFVNNGTISVDGYDALTVNATAFTQAGSIDLGANATLRRYISGTATGTGFTNSGTLSGAGTIDVGSGTLTNAGVIAPGTATGDTTATLSITGNLAMASGGQLNLNLSTPLVTDYDKLAVSGTVSLAGGTINLAGIGGAGSYPVIAAASLTGTATISAGGFTQTPTYAGTGLTLGVTANSGLGLYWDRGANTNNWHDANNWSTNQVPGAADNVYIGSGGGTVQVSTAGQAANALTVDSGFTLSAGSLSLGGASVFRGNYTTSGKLTAISGGTLTGSGAITLASGAYLQWTGGTIDGTAATTLTTAAGSEALVAGGTLGANRTWNNSGKASVRPESWTKLGTLNQQAGELNIGAYWYAPSAFTRAQMFSFNRSGGAVNLTGTLDNTGYTLDIGSAGPFGAGGLTSMCPYSSYSSCGGIKNGTLVSTDGTALTSKGNGYTPTLDGVTLAGATLNTSGGFAFINALTLADGLTVNKGNGGWSFNTDGSMHLATAGSATINNAGGTIGVYRSSYAAPGQTLFIDSGITLQGYGSFSAGGGYYTGGGGNIVNAGTINANTASQTLTIAPSAFTNNGTINASQGTLNLSRAFTNNGTINVDGATVKLGGEDTSWNYVVGFYGPYRWSNTGAINLNSGTLNLSGIFTPGDLSAGHYSRQAGTRVNLTNTLDNTGNVLDIGSAGLFGPGGLNSFSGTIRNGTVLSADGTPLTMPSAAILNNVTLGGTSLTTSGDVKVDGNAITLADGLTVNKGSGNWTFYGSLGELATTGSATLNSAGGTWGRGYYSGSTMQIDSGVTLQGYGTFSGLSVVNNGTLLLNAAGQSSNISGTLANNGTLGISAGSMTVAGAVTQAGTLDVASGATFTRTGGFTNTGTLAGNGMIVVGTGTAKLVNQGDIKPGGSGATGTLSIVGDLQLSTGSNLNMELAGTGAGQYDKLAVSGALTGNAGSFGNLALTESGSFRMAGGNGFPLVGAGSVATATTFAPLALTDITLTPAYSATDFTLGIANAVTSWNTDSSGNWATAANWTRGVPDATTPALIDRPTANPTVTVDTAEAAAALTVGSGDTLAIGASALTLNGPAAFTGGAVLSVSSGATLNNNATLSLGAATTLAGTIKGGTLFSSATLTGNTGKLDGVTLGGSALTASGTFLIYNGITLADGLTVNKGSGYWFFGTGGTQHIATTGAATIASSGGSLVAGHGVSGQTLQIDSGVTFQGYGALLQDSAATLVNAGTIRANTANQQISILPATFTNTGALEVAGGRMSISPSAAATPSWSNPGTLSVSGGILSLGGRFTAADLGSGHYSRTGTSTVFLRG